MTLSTDAWAEANASVPASLLVYFTLEFQHPGFVEGLDEVPVRIVTGTTENVSLGIEADALFNPSEMVTFTAIPFEAEFPEFAEGKVPETTLIIDNVSRELVPHIEAAAAIRADLKALYREYRSDDTSAPCFGPVEFVVRNIMMVGTRIEGQAMIDNLSNKRFPRRIYTTQEYPGLQP